MVTRRTLALLVMMTVAAACITGCKRREPAAGEGQPGTETRETTPEPQGVPEPQPGQEEPGMEEGPGEPGTQGEYMEETIIEEGEYTEPGTEGEAGGQQGGTEDGDQPQDETGGEQPQGEQGAEGQQEY